jgi:cytochrome c oxidase subunit 2
MLGGVNASVENHSSGLVRNRTSRARRNLGLLGLVLTPLLLSSCTVPSFGAASGVTDSSHRAYKLWQGFMVTGLIVGGLTLFLIVYAALRYRRKSEAIPRQFQYVTWIEIVYTVIPTIIVGVLFYFTIVVENPEVARVAHPAAQADVVAFQWGWRFDYPGHPNITTVGQTTENPTLVLPVGETDAISLRSLDVVHGFYVKEFNYSEYAQPGVTNHFDLHVDKAGSFQAQCTQLCGLYHSLMYFKVVTIPAQAYQSCLTTSTDGTSFVACANAALAQTAPLTATVRTTKES